MAATFVAALSMPTACCGNTESSVSMGHQLVVTSTTLTSASPSPVTHTDSQISNGKSYTVTVAPIEGATADGRGHWRAEVGRISGGDPRVAESFNKAGNASARYQIDQVRADADTSSPWRLEIQSALTFRPIAIAQVLTGVYYAKDAAHPTNYVSTVVIDSRNAKPITLSDLFITEQDGLNRFSEQTKRIWPTTYGGGEPMSDEPGNRPIAENFANWIPTAEGIQIHFADYQFGHGSPVITVPWSSLTDVLAPDMKALAQR